MDWSLSDPIGVLALIASISAVIWTYRQTQRTFRITNHPVLHIEDPALKDSRQMPDIYWPNTYFAHTLKNTHAKTSIVDITIKILVSVRSTLFPFPWSRWWAYGSSFAVPSIDPLFGVRLTTETSGPTVEEFLVTFHGVLEKGTYSHPGHPTQYGYYHVLSERPIRLRLSITYRPGLPKARKKRITRTYRVEPHSAIPEHGGPADTEHLQEWLIVE